MRPMSPRIAPSGPILDAADYRRRFPTDDRFRPVSRDAGSRGATVPRGPVEDTMEDYQRFLAAP